MDLGLNRRNLGRLVLLAWAVALAWLARRELTRSDETLTASRALRIAPGAHYYALFAGDRQVGQVNVTLDTLVEGSRLNELWVADLPLGDSTHQVASSGEFALTRSFQLQRYIRKNFGFGLPDELDLSLAGATAVTFRELEGPRLVATGRAPADSRAILPAMLPFRAALADNLHVGRTFRVAILDAESGHSRPVEVRVTAESTFIVPDSAAWDSVGGRWAAVTLDTVRAWRLEHDARGPRTVDWVDRGGVLVREEIAGGTRLERTAFEMARNNYNIQRRAESSAWRRGIPGASRLAPGGVPADAAPSQRFLIQHDSTVSRSAFAYLDGDRQRLSGDTLLVLRSAPRDTSGGVPAPPVWTDWLPAEASVERAARAALSGLPAGSTPDAKVRRLTEWVAREIVTDTASGAPAVAITTLLRRRGGADGKAALLVAMARAAGLPARRVAGVAVLPSGTFAHAWAEIWTGAWTAADPLSGEVPASPSLIRLLVGKRSRFMDLLPVAGSARFLPLPPGR